MTRNPSGLELSRTLRVIGQSLEAAGALDFDLEAEGASYVVRGRRLVTEQPQSTAATSTPERLRGVLGMLTGLPTRLSQTHPPHAHDTSLEERYASDGIEQLDSQGKARRRNPKDVPDHRSLSQQLRCIGDYLELRNARLVRLSKRQQAIAVEYATADGTRIEEERTIAAVYNLSVRMFLRRTDMLIS